MVINAISATVLEEMKRLAPAAVVAMAVLAELTLGRAKGAPDFALFFGRFHPLVVHLPIGFLILLGLGEAATFQPKWRPRVEPALGLLVPVSVIAALGAFLLGQLLALEGGYPAGALAWHRRLTLLAVVAMSACWALFDRQTRSGDGRWMYRGALVAALGLLSLGAHFGGTMTRGESYLSKYAPAPLKPLLGAAEPKSAAVASAAPATSSAEPLVYQDVLQPLLEQYCVECHGPDKQKAKLRLDSFDEMMKGGEDSNVVTPGLPKFSPLLVRMLLPANDDHRMPPEGKAGPGPDALALFEFWIARGASPKLKVKDVLAPAVSRALLEHALGGAPASGAVPVAAPSGSTTPALPAPAASLSTSPAASSASPWSGSPAAPNASSASPAAPSTSSTAPHAVATTGPAVLRTYCEKCHGAQKQKGKLRVDSLSALLQGGSGGPALVSGHPEQSAIVKRTRLPLGDDDHMPPAKETQPSAAEIAELATWIKAGAPERGFGAAPSTSGAKSAVAAGAQPTSRSEPPAVAESPSAAPVPQKPDASSELPVRVALFRDAVEPLLREKCGKCHIKDKPAGGLNVSTHAQLLEGGFSGAALVPGDRKASVLMQRIVLPPSDGDHMPPDDEPALTADEIELIGAFIDRGAPASGSSDAAALPLAAQRALAARNVPGSSEPAAEAPKTNVATAAGGTGAVATAAQPPPPLPARAGGCAACSVAGAPRSALFGLQALALLGVGAALVSRRARRSRDRSVQAR